MPLPTKRDAGGRFKAEPKEEDREDDDREEREEAPARPGRDEPTEVELEDDDEPETDADGNAHVTLPEQRQTRREKKLSRIPEMEARAREAEARAAAAEAMARQSQNLLQQYNQYQQLQQPQQPQQPAPPTPEDLEIQQAHYQMRKLTEEFEALPPERQREHALEMRTKYQQLQQHVASMAARKENRALIPEIARALQQQTQAALDPRKVALLSRHSDLVPRGAGGNAPDARMLYHWQGLYLAKVAELGLHPNSPDVPASVYDETAEMTREKFGLKQKPTTRPDDSTKSRFTGIPAVSRDGSGRSRVQLTKEEVKIARSAYPHLSEKEALRRVAKQKLLRDDD